MAHPNATPDIGQDLSILVEIVSGRHLLVGDRTTSDPYVIVKLGQKEIHRTKYISKTLNPNWSPDTKSIFLLHCPAWELFDNDGLVLDVEDMDMLSPDDPLGTVRVDGTILCAGEGKLTEFKIQPPKGMEGLDAGVLNLRFRRATKSDIESLANHETKQLFE